MIPANNSNKEPVGELSEVIKEDFGNFERFKKEFTQVASSVEGSGWAALSFCKGIKRLGIMQIEKHNVNIIPSFPILMVLDVWEHAYYIDYKNESGKFTEQDIPADLKKKHEIIQKSKTAIITSHINSDADAIGSEVAFYLYLKECGINAKIINNSEVYYSVRKTISFTKTIINAYYSKCCFHSYPDAIPV